MKNIKRVVLPAIIAGVFSGCFAPEYKIYSNNNKGFPKIEKVITLTPLDAYSSSGVYFLPNKVDGEMELSFEMNIFDNDGSSTARWNSADGIALMIGKNSAVYEQKKPPVGGTLGYIQAGGGLAILFKTYEKRVIILKGVDGKELYKIKEPLVYTDGKWVDVKLKLTSKLLELYFNNKKVISYQGNFKDIKGSIGFSAATGGANSRHQIKNIKIK